jgi:hypothetical protein
VNALLWVLVTIAQAPAEKQAATVIEHLHAEYRADAGKYSFHADAERSQPLQLVEKPVMKWANDDDWSGDIFLWTKDGLPAVIGCMLSGPAGETSRNMFHEFHLLAERPIAAADLQTRRTWQPAEGLKRLPLTSAPHPVETSAGRLTQMRQIAKRFSAHMEASGTWELRLLPQPLFRYGGGDGQPTDGALFTWVWSKGTDPELILLVELRPGDGTPQWHYAPVRFSNRALWLKYENAEVWRAQSHAEPEGGRTTQIYTTAYARSFPRSQEDEHPRP